MKVRIYTRTLERWYSIDEYGREDLTQSEMEYKEFESTTGELVGYGTEDIQYGRTRNGRNRYTFGYIYTWDGVKRSKGYTNNRTFDHRRDVMFRPGKGTRKALAELALHWFPDAVDVQVRSR